MLVFTLSAALCASDSYNYYPSNNPFADLGPIQQETVAQQRSLLNAGVLGYVTYTKGIHNIKAGVTYQQTFLNEHDQFGIVDPTLNSPCVDANGNSVVRIHRSRRNAPPPDFSPTPVSHRY